MDNLIGKTLDGLYTVRELIGTGGMANVYKAVVGPVSYTHLTLPTTERV